MEDFEVRKKALRKIEDRHKIIKALREKNTLSEIITRNGKSVILNFDKHFLLRRPYKNEEYQREMYRHLKKQIKEEEDDRSSRQKENQGAI